MAPLNDHVGRCNRCGDAHVCPESFYGRFVPDWEHIAVSLARANGAYHLLTTPERDALETAMGTHPQADPNMPYHDYLRHLRGPDQVD